MESQLTCSRCKEAGNGTQRSWISEVTDTRMEHRCEQGHVYYLDFEKDSENHAIAQKMFDDQGPTPLD